MLERARLRSSRDGWFSATGFVHAMLVGLLLSSACSKRVTTTPAPEPSASAIEQQKTAQWALQRRAELRSAEYRRDASALSREDLAATEVEVRRDAARAAARIADERAAELLTLALADEDAEVLSWAAYGLGYVCGGREAVVVPALAIRASSLLERGMTPPPRATLHPIRSIFDALARCASDDAQRVLRSWLGGVHPSRTRQAFAEEAALGLGKLGSRTHRLDDASVVALLDAADDPDAPLDNALFAFSRLGPLDPSIQERLLQVSKAALPRNPLSRTFALRALGKAGPSAAPTLLRSLRDATLTATERALAARSLAELGPAGEDAVASILDEVVPSSDALAAGQFGESDFAPLLTLVESLKKARPALVPALTRLATAALPGEPRAARRIVRLRCAGASVLAGTLARDARLLACDPAPGSQLQALAALNVLDRSKIVGANAQQWLSFAQTHVPVVQQRALELMATHPEIPNPAVVLATSLEDPNPGVVASAADVLAEYPDRSAAKFSPGAQAADGTLAPRPDVSIATLLKAAIEKTWPSDALETENALIKAVGALGLLALRPKVDAYCKSPNVTLRKSAEQALERLGSPKHVCPAPPASGPAAKLEDLAEVTRVEFVTDVGVLPMTLVSRYAPLAVAQTLELVRSGFYDGIVVHRVVPGFVAQFGDPDADGYGGAQRPPLPCETTPLPFEAWNVGVALSGRDTGTSQLFVTLDSFPHLDGNYAWLGQADPAWQKLDRGDRILKAHVVGDASPSSAPPAASASP